MARALMPGAMTTRAADQPLFLEGRRLFHAGEWFECHEAWEELWLATPGPHRELYRGLIMAAVALEHWRRGNHKGASQMWAKAEKRLEAFVPEFEGVRVGPFLERLREQMALLFRSAAPPAPTPSDVPRLGLVAESQVE